MRTLLYRKKYANAWSQLLQHVANVVKGASPESKLNQTATDSWGLKTDENNKSNKCAASADCVTCWPVAVINYDAIVTTPTVISDEGRRRKQHPEKCPISNSNINYNNYTKKFSYFHCSLSFVISDKYRTLNLFLCSRKGASVFFYASEVALKEAKPIQHQRGKEE